MDYQEKARRVIQIEIDELARLRDRLDGDFVTAVDLLRAALDQRGKIVVLGVGKSGAIGRKLAATLSSTGAPAANLNCQDALHGDLGLVDAGDAVVALSYSGETRELIDVLPHLKRRPIALIAITGRPGSSLAKASDVALDVNVEREACPLNLAPTSSTTNMLALCDALAMVLLEARGFRKEDFAELHPGGSLGRVLLTRVTDIMRTGEAFVVVNADEPVGGVLEKMTRARAGAVVVVDPEGRLGGIFTQGDFVRAFQRRADVATLPVGDCMTRNPICITSDKLASEVLRLFDDHRIDDLVVLDAERRPVGMVDTQDLSRLQIL
ncbi:MAG: KpsF/GutQ family sugar-phosphate isomerase [Verrucomicrobiales bacterium]|nr:KpsF/GutQ family sugar-phosphate isomerase [Verrucomicrobiales bacterium]